MMRNPREPRRNACSWPPSCYQIFTWILFLVCNLIFYTSVIPLYSDLVRNYVLSVSLILCTALFIVFLFASLLDPADPILLESFTDNRISLWRVFATTCKEPEILVNGHHLRYCHMCAVYVHTTSFHCSFCMKCIHHFDHHCLWMNNCVGSRNYRWFMASTIFAFLANSFMSLSSLYLVVDSYTSRICSSLVSNHRNHFVHNNSSLDSVIIPATPGHFPSYKILFIPCNAETWKGIVVTNLVILAIISVFLLIMIFFHLYLKIKKISTLGFLRRRKMKKIKNECVKDLIANTN